MKRQKYYASEQRADEILKRCPEGGAVCEVGTARGKALFWLLKKRPDIRVVVVDDWLPSELQPQSYKDTRDQNAFMSAKSAADRRQAALQVMAPHGDRVKLYEGRSVDMAAKIGQDGWSFDVVFIDADHSFEGCHADIAAYTPLVKRGGWIGGHDYHNRRSPKFDFTGVDRAVDGFAAIVQKPIEKGLNYTWFINL